MSRSRLTVVLSQAPGKHPAKRSLEESVVAALLLEPDLEVSVVPNLYDLGPDHTGRLFLGSVTGDMVVLSWL
ncbi:MAG TPA: ferredoxin family protein, partial [Gemmata sp.]